VVLQLEEAPRRCSSYLGKTDQFDRAIAEFARRYADQTERDHQALVHAITDGRVEALVDRER
jgi:hypothetical protein